MSKVNWNKENTEKLLNAYDGDNSQLSKIATEFGTTVPSIRSKLVNLQVYVTPEKKASTASQKTSKAQKVAAVETMLSIQKGALVSLEKATSKDLDTLTSAIIKASDAVNVKVQS